VPSKKLIPLAKGAPIAPVITEVLVDDQTAEVRFTNKARTTAVTSFIVVATPGGATCEAEPEIEADAKGDAEDIACPFDELKNGQGYTFTVTAINSYGKGAASLPSKVVTPGKDPRTPGTPSIASVSARSGSITVTATPGSGGQAAEAYVFYASPGDDVCSSTTPTCEFGGMSNDVQYSFTVDARNAYGTSEKSSNSRGITPDRDAAVPDGPKVISVDRNGTSARVTVTRSSGGGSPEQYTVTASPNGASCTTTGNACTITGLSASETYRFAVTASNSFGSTTGEPSGSVAGLPPARENPPAKVRGKLA